MKKVFAIVVMCCAFVFALGLAACGGSSSGSAPASGAASGSDSAASSASESSGGGSADAAAAGYLDESGTMTAKALIDLNGADLTKLAESAGYKWEEKHADWTRLNSDVSPTKGLTKEESEAAGYNLSDTSKYNFTPEEIAGFAVGAKGTPVKWSIMHKYNYTDAADVLASQQVKVVDQCEVEHRNYGKQVWAIVENSAGDQFLLSASYYSNKGVIEVFNSDYLEKNSRGVASCFNLGDYLLADVHTIDGAFEVIKSGQVS